VALKMSFHYWKNKGEVRDLFFSLENSYHGETIGALSVGDVGLYKDTYKEILIKNIAIPIPKDKSEEETNKALKNARVMFEKYHKKVSALIIEPLVPVRRIHENALAFICQRFKRALRRV